MQQIIKQETLRHKEAFEIYYTLGHKRSYKRTALKMSVSPQSIRAWAISFNWKERVILRDNRIGNKLEKATEDAVTGEKKQLLAILLKSLADVIDENRELKVAITNQQDLVSTVKAASQLMGDQVTTKLDIVFNFGGTNNDEKSE